MIEEFKLFNDGSRKLLFVSNFGTVKSVDKKTKVEHFLRDRIGKTCKRDKVGYKSFAVTKTPLRQKSFLVHQCVMKLFGPPKPTDQYYEIDHIDGEKHNNHISNLRWVTRSQNTQSAYDLGLIPKGVKHYKRKLTQYPEETIDRAIALALGGGCISQIERDFGFGRSYLAKILFRMRKKRI